MATADMLESTVDSVTSALKWARAGLQSRLPQTAAREPPPARDSSSGEDVVATFVRAWESADLGALVALLTDDVFISMPPCLSNTKATRLRPGSAAASFVRPGGSTSCRHGPTVSQRLGPTCAPLRASATGPVGCRPTWSAPSPKSSNPREEERSHETSPASRGGRCLRGVVAALGWLVPRWCACTRRRCARAAAHGSARRPCRRRSRRPPPPAAPRSGPRRPPRRARAGSRRA